MPEFARATWLVEVNDKRVDALTTTEVADMLKGPKGTKVQVIVNRGATKPITFNLVRDEIRETVWTRLFG